MEETVNILMFYFLEVSRKSEEQAEALLVQIQAVLFALVDGDGPGRGRVGGGAGGYFAIEKQTRVDTICRSCWVLRNCTNVSSVSRCERAVRPSVPQPKRMSARAAS